jgi:hypothetical protein
MLEHIIKNNKTIRTNIRSEDKQEYLDALKNMENKWFKKKIGKRLSFYYVTKVEGTKVHIKRAFENKSSSILHPPSYYGKRVQHKGIFYITYPPSTNLHTFLNGLEEATEEDIQNAKMKNL